MAILLTMMSVLVPMFTYGDVVTVDVSHSVVTAGDGTQYIHVSVPTPEARAKTIVGFVELRFEANVDEDLEVELWEDTGVETNPWDLEDVTNVSQAKWVMDRDGAPSVRFDITKLAQDWLSETKANNGVYVRLRQDQAALDMALMQDPKMKLVYHVLSVSD
jgi:hypothetical protein